MKKCFKCLSIKPLSEFYKHKRMADGHLNKCKDCAKSDVKKNRDENKDYYKEYDAWRFKNDPMVKDRHKRYLLTPEGVSAMRKAQYDWIKSNPEKRAAHVLLGNAVRSGKIDKPENCSSCGMFFPKRKIHAHHHDYTKPLDVTWLCLYCHVDLHHGEYLWNNDPQNGSKRAKVA